MRLLKNKIFLGFLFLFLGLGAFSQDRLSSDILLIKKVRVDHNHDSKTVRPYIYGENSTAFQKANPVNMVFGGLLFLYQNTLSQQFSANCLYNPSCSEFSKQCIHDYGILKGMFLSADRIMRCNRIAATGIHPLRIENNKVSDPVNFYVLGK